MEALAFPACEFRFKSTKNGQAIFDPIRKKYVALTPEEWVRQHCLQWLLKDQAVPAIRIRVEASLQLLGMPRRADIAVFAPDGPLWLVVECKAPSVPITESVFDQVARYNRVLQAPYLMVTNGRVHYFCAFQPTGYQFIPQLPTCP